MEKLKKILPHLLFILSAMFITFWILDIYNPLMNFVNSSISRKLLLVFCILTLLYSCLMIADNINNKEEQNK